MPARNHIDLVGKTLRVLEALSEQEHGAGLKDVAGRVGLVKSSVFRILFTLREMGYVEQAEPNGAYRLSVKVAGLALRSRRPTLISLARPHLMWLRDQLREPAWLAELRRGDVVLVDMADEGSHRLRLSFDIGDRCPYHATAVGKAVAAYLPRAELEAALGKGKLPRYTLRTIRTRAAFQAELETVRRLGYAVNEEETVPGAVLVGAPVFDANDRAFAALSVSAPTPRCSPEKRRAMIGAVKQAGVAVSRDLARAGFVAG